MGIDTVKVVWKGGDYYERFRREYGEPLIEELEKHGFEITQENPDLVITIGGDGTFFRTARRNPDSMLLGLRAESKGAVLDSDYSEYKLIVEKLAGGEYEIVEYPKVKMAYDEKTATGLNDVYFIRDTANLEQAIRFRVYIDGVDYYSDLLYADGCLLATPLGSRAYNHNCGGPAIERGEGLVLTPIMACLMNKTMQKDGFRVSSRAEPIILDGDEEVILEVVRGGETVICADDNNVHTDFKLSEGEKIRFTISDETASIVQILR